MIFPMGHPAFSTASLFPYKVGAPAPEIHVSAAGNAQHTRGIRVKLNTDSVTDANQP